MIEKPPPLNPQFLRSPKDNLKRMLEASDRRDQGLPSPLDEIDPMSLDELMNRIDTGSLALNQIPTPEDVDKIVAYFWALREKHNFELQMGIVNRPKRGVGKKSLPSAADMFDEEDE